MASKVWGGGLDRYNAYEAMRLAEAGLAYRVCQAFGTGIAAGVVTGFVTTTPLLVMVNTSSTKLVIPHYLRLINTAAGASSVSGHLGITTDVINRYSSGGTDLSSLVKNARSDDSEASAVTVLRFGAITAAGASAEKQLARAVLKTQASPCWTIGDEVLINFLTRDATSKGALAGSTPVEITKNVGPVVLSGANHSLMVHQWNPSNSVTPPSWEVEMGWFETPKAA